MIFARAVALTCLLACVSGGGSPAQNHARLAQNPPARGPITMHERPTTGTYLPALGSFDEMVLTYMEAHHIPGAALAIVRNGQLIYTRGYGYADLEEKTPATPMSLFRLASVSKPITSVAIMTLVQSGKLNIDAPVFPLLGLKPFLLPGHQPDPLLNSITIRHLLGHAGGWDRGKSGDIMFQHFQAAREMGIASPPDHESLIRWAMGRPLDFTPGTRSAYSNFGFCVLGRVIEKVSGMPYEKYVQTRVLAPAGIHNMRIGKGHLAERFPQEVHYYDPADRTSRSVFSADGRTPVPLPYAFASPETMDAHGGWIASAVDMAHFMAKLDVPGEQPLLSTSTVATMFARPQPPLGLDENGALSAAYYAFGWNVRPVGNNGKANVWHDGAMPGTSTLMVRLNNGLSWVILFNARADGNIDGLLHQAAAKVKEWPDQNLFRTYAEGVSTHP
ncbi:MAG: penicillin-binding protein beta-lactamase class [Chthonomonadales bacterium]|nr:penicillin-binding protein beta-lactamase class [Chthonomonadales bacterium]